MPGTGDWRKLLSIAAVVLGTALGAAGAASGSTLTTLYSFGPVASGDGAAPYGPLAFDQLGALYGTTRFGGAHRAGTVFKLTPPIDPSAPWTERTLWRFTGNQEGGYPDSGVIFDKAGNLYGTTSGGGTINVSCVGGCGTVFQGIPPTDPNGPWGGQILWGFTGMSDGGFPGGLVLDDATGVLYGATSLGGLRGQNCDVYCGTLFKLTPPPSADAAWTFSVLWQFTGGADGGNPSQDGRLALDASGVLYGTTTFGGAYGHGTVFQLTPGQAPKTIWNFTGGVDGRDPSGSLTFNSGRLFGATGGGAFGFGTVFEGFPPATPDGDWGGAVYGFTGGADGAGPNGSLVFDSAGNLYGTASGGGSGRAGTIFEGIPPADPSDPWGGRLLWSFRGADGAAPGPLIFDAAGAALYGTTIEGGAGFNGTVFKLAP